ncbi:UNVERIFIED_CONTAM: putative ABC transport system permease protein [Paenibacillus sp. PvR008]
MRKIVASFLVLLSILSFIRGYIQTDIDEFNKIDQMEKTIASPFSIPDNLLLADPEQVYPILLESAIQAKVNIFRPGINNKPNNEVEIVKYVLLTSSTQLYNYIHIVDGKVVSFEDTQQSSHFLSSVHTDDPNQIGSIQDFGKNDLITLSPLRLSFQHLPVAGTYFAETQDHQGFQKFLTIFTEKLNVKYQKYLKTPFTIDSFAYNTTVAGSMKTFESLDYLTYIQYALFFMILLLFIFSVFQESKAIGIYKMHGITSRRVWFIVMGKMIVVTGCLSVVISALLAILIPNTDTGFVIGVMLYQLGAYGIVLIPSLISYAYISRVGMHQIIKNRKNTNSIFMLNTLAKVICSIFIVTLGTFYVHQYTNLIQQQEDIKGWKNIKDYGVFYPLFIGYDAQDMQQNSPEFHKITANQFYPFVNRMSSLLINTRQYEEIALILNKDYNGIRSILVNSNYLKEYPLYDIKQKPIQIAENNGKSILLVPDKYRNREKEILLFFKEDRQSFKEYQTEYYKIPVPEHLQKTEIQIIWLKNNQKVFSFNPEVFKAEHNVIIDPIIQVVTENNSFTSDRVAILGNGGSDPLKIKLINRDTAQTYKALEPQLKKLHLDDNLKYLITVDQYMLTKVNDLQNGMNMLLLLIGGLLVGLLFFVVQNLIVFFKKYQQVFVVRRLFGFGFFKTYREFISLFTVLWIIQAGIALMINQNTDIGFFLVLAFFIVVELIASIIALIIIERKNRVLVLKGGAL